MQKRTRAILSVLAAAVLLAGATAAGALVLRGQGELHAAGSGLAVIDIRGRLAVRGIGLMVVDEAADLELHGEGRVTPLGDGRLLVEGFGRAVVRSPDARTRVELAGARIRLHARGRGVARLLGHGVVYTEDLDARWNPDVEVEFDSDPAAGS